MNIITEVTQCLKENNNKLSPTFIDALAKKAKIQYLQLTPTMRICVITLESGHEVYGVAQVLDPANDIEEIGNAVAYKNAVESLWHTIGSIAKAVL